MSEDYYTSKTSLNYASKESISLKDDYWVVNTGFSFIFTYLNKNHSVTVHRGFLTNGKSIPFFLRKYVEKHIAANDPCLIIYDWLNEYLLLECDFALYPIAKREANKVFLKAMACSHVPIKERLFIYRALMCWLYLSYAFKPTFNPFKRHLEDHYFYRLN